MLSVYERVLKGEKSIMLNESYKQQAIYDLKQADAQYMKVFKTAISDMEKLYSARKLSVDTIQRIEQYVTSLTNRPRNYDMRMGEIKIRYVKFCDQEKEIYRSNQRRQEQLTAKSIGIAGVVAGAGVATLAPTAAMSVAMTFGTASTGAAISSLSGAAATNAALAWLGGGTLASGAAGMAGGQALLTMAGPIGWFIGGVSLAGSLLAINESNNEIARKTEESIVAIKKEMERIKKIDLQVKKWNEETKALTNILSKQLRYLKQKREFDYKKFLDRDLNELAALMNGTELLSKKIGERIQGTLTPP